MLKFPKTTLPPADQKLVEDLFFSSPVPILEGSEILISHWPFDSVVGESLRLTARTGRIAQGLESIAKLLDDEKKGLLHVQTKTAQAPANRMSRLLLISNDGSERFYRQTENLLKKHGERLWCCRLNASSEELGAIATMGGNPAKAVLIDDKKVLVGFIGNLARALSSG